MRILLTVGLLSAFLLGLWLGGFSLKHSEPNVPKFHKYDVNQDGIVSQVDVLHIINYLNNQQTNKSAAMKSSEVAGKATKEDLSNIIAFQSKMMLNQFRILQNQALLSVGQLRIHHFIEPHVNFYPNCTECQKDKEEMNKTIKHTRQDSTLQPTD